MSVKSQLRKAGLKVKSIWDDDRFYIEAITENYYKSLLLEVKTRKCTQKACRKHGCDCE
jgi:hypothetical protein